MLLAIFRDFGIQKSALLVLDFLSLCSLLPSCWGQIFFEFQVLLISTAIVTALSTFQLLYSYFSMERVQAYYQLPLSLNRFKGSFLTVTFLLNLLERVLLLILFLGVRLDLLQSFKLVLLSLLVVLSVFISLSSFNTRLSLLGGVLISVTTVLTASSLWVQQVSYMILLSALVTVFIFKNEDLIAISKNDQLLVDKEKKWQIIFGFPCFKSAIFPSILSLLSSSSFSF